ncbi:unnamed protein product [Parnassius apollo]|uniref:(apollo) hypothetical protein n=1 Tax=Parnassius apollo TaxID=110799 RepID=A0A8S3XYM8_PARAO|nr:unnamed protein product [Parnassius apollo]
MQHSNYDLFAEDPLSWFRCGAKTKRAQCSGIRRAGHTLPMNHTQKMSPRTLVVLVAIACLYQAAAKPVRRTLTFNMFVLKPKEGAPERTILTTDGVSRFGPIIEYLVQRIQGLMSVRNPPEHLGSFHSLPNTDEGDVTENEIDSVQSRMPGIAVRPSLTKPGTYEVDIDVVVDDGQPNYNKNN